VITSYKATPDIDVLTSSFPIPGFGFVPINAFVLHGPEPLLVDTGAVVEHEEFMTACDRSSIPPTSSGSGSPTQTSTTSGPCTSSWPRTPTCGSSPRSSASAS
jgi:hypothetical protein